MTIDKGMARLVADFNSSSDRKTLVGQIDYSGRAVLPAEGETVVIGDPEGNFCLGMVLERLDDEHFRVMVDWESWEDGEEMTRVPETLSAPVDLMEALRRSVAKIQERRTGDIPATRGDPRELKAG